MANEALMEELNQEVKMDMTPMIDVCFELIIFFMLITEVSSNAKEKFKLPLAEKTSMDVVEPGRLMVNIN